MKCRVCGSRVSGESCSEPQALLGVGCYAIMFNCRCGATLAIVMWLSEDEALQRHAEEQRYQAHRAAMDELRSVRGSGAGYAVIRRLEQQEERLSYAE